MCKYAISKKTKTRQNMAYMNPLGTLPFWVCLFLCMCEMLGMVSWSMLLWWMWDCVLNSPWTLSFYSVEQSPSPKASLDTNTHPEGSSSKMQLCSFSRTASHDPKATDTPSGIHTGELVPMSGAVVPSKLGHYFVFSVRYVERQNRKMTDCAGIMWCCKKRIVRAVLWCSTCLVVFWEYGSFLPVSPSYIHSP